MSVEEKYSEVKQLIAIGKEKGFLLYDEIYEVLPEEVTSLPEELDEIYDRWAYLPEKREALAKYEAFLVKLLGSGET